MTETTESEWLTNCDPEQMLRFPQGSLLPKDVRRLVTKRAYPGNFNSAADIVPGVQDGEWRHGKLTGAVRASAP
jgi:hypothetical protein